MSVIIVASLDELFP